MHQIPMLLDITQYNQVGVIEAEMDDGMLIVRNLILQIVLCNCYTEVKLACIYDKNIKLLFRAKYINFIVN